MAGTVKQKQLVWDTPADGEPGKLYSVGVYARLSVDMDEKKRESIETQVEIAKAFISRQKDMELYDCYTDMGKSGTNFRREGFGRMMGDVRARKINCIVVKDLSRFGRNHIETGNYMEKVFPFMGVRFIAVTDGYDSLACSGQGDAWGVNLKNLVNEMYAKDIAVKVKSGKRIKWEQGSYTGGIPPYGYRAEWIDGKKRLFTEEVTSDIVRKIYDLFLSGQNRKEIAVWLYENKIVRPAVYHQTGQIYSRDREGLEEWSRGTIKLILTNPVYMGCLVQGRTCGKDYKMRDRHDIDSGDWSVREHTHEAIVSKEQFFEAAAKFEQHKIYCSRKGFSKKIPLEEDIFAGVLYCGGCGAGMHRISALKELGSKDKVRTYSYHCPNRYRIDEWKCTGKDITLYTLVDIVKKAIWQEFSLSPMRPEALAESNNREAEAVKRKWNMQLTALEKRLDRIATLGSEQYLRYRMGEMEEAQFLQAMEENRKKTVSLQQEKAEIMEIIRKVDAQTAAQNRLIRTFWEEGKKVERKALSTIDFESAGADMGYKNGKSEKGGNSGNNEKSGSNGNNGNNGLTAEMVRTLINRIEVYPEQRIKVIFAFKRKDIFAEK
ncbi:MAG: recombinase family protein [Blautia sp.]|nr:recombinase family protein [Blautia sp.]